MTNNGHERMTSEFERISKKYKSWKGGTLPESVSDCMTLIRLFKADSKFSVELISQTEKLEDFTDLMKDEFLRIKSISENSEIVGLCDRAIKNINQHVPVIVQRDRFERELADAKREIEALKKKDPVCECCLKAHREQAILRQELKRAVDLLVMFGNKVSEVKGFIQKHENNL